jgi:putative SOS response-associated peptidase YedK
MCGRFVTIIPPEELAKIFALIEKPQLEHRYNVAPNQQVAVVRSIDDQNVMSFMKWGLIRMALV